MQSIFAIWPTLADMARDLGLPYQTVAAWMRRSAIPAKYDLALVKAAEQRGVDLSFEELATVRAGGIASKQSDTDRAPEVAAR